MKMNNADAMTNEEAAKHGERLAKVLNLTPSETGMFFLGEGYLSKTHAGLFRTVCRLVDKMRKKS